MQFYNRIVVMALFGIATINRRYFESGDADSSGSTLRAAGVIALVLAVVALLGSAVYTAANAALNQLASR